MFKVFITILLSGLLMTALIVGCSDDDNSTTPTTPGTNTLVDLADLAAIIEEVAPPEYVGPSASSQDIDSAWLYGQSPLLDAVFGSREPEALYTNVNFFKMFMDIIAGVVMVDGDGNFVPGILIDSVEAELGEETLMMHFTATGTAVTSASDVPAIAQMVMGTTIDIDFLISIEIEEVPDASIAMGVKLTDDEQTLWQWDAGMGDPTNTESRLIYASLDLADSSFIFKGVGYCQHEDLDEFRYAFNISSEASSNFTYRMSYYSNGSGYPDFLHCVVGGGSKDVEFALKYRLFKPADTTVCDSTNMLDQVFGPDYSEGTGLISAYEEYLGDELLFEYDAVPDEMIVSPWAE